ncbi:OmpH family outer membrane protein [Solitalea koreensis]|uniref:Periplasmic chaperone for outer membrane proteins Skp n=1 Tax=Solitalea koreensis TaxID=543615 RepID=A0A521D0R3_9SPHI|nr:OmpH family outer membrane protein [Solitalea koreensis]SMO65285.1 periplasmic chaperone for outer membrane proteins Skp [Solitalea koreensis]
MKRSIKVLVVALVLLFAGAKAEAQVKFGHINVGELVSSMPDIKDADKKIQEFANTLDGQMKTMTTEYQTKIADFQAKEKTMTDPIKEAKVKEIQDLEKRIGEFQQKAQQDIQKKQEELYAPILKKAEDAIKAVAAENKIGYVFDSSKGVIIVSPDGDNILPLVKKKLAIQ